MNVKENPRGRKSSYQTTPIVMICCIMKMDTKLKKCFSG